MNTTSTSWEDIVLQWRWSVVRIYNTAWLLFDLDDPLSKLTRVWNGSRKEAIFDLLGQKDNGFFPNYTSLLVTHVMDLIENNPCHFPYDLATIIKHQT